MLPVMPMEPTRPMPSRSSGTKDMAMPCLRMSMGSMPTRFSVSAVLRVVIGDGAVGNGIKTRDGLQQLPLAAAGHAGNAQHLAAR